MIPGAVFDAAARQDLGEPRAAVKLVQRDEPAPMPTALAIADTRCRAATTWLLDAAGISMPRKSAWTWAS
jgi:hypothetical protein